MEKRFHVCYGSKIGGKVLGEQKVELFGTVKDINECMYKVYSQKSQFVLMNYFPCFPLLTNYSNEHFHFLVINKYFCSDNFM